MKETISRYFLGHANDFTVRGCEFEIETTVGDGVCGGGVRGCECESESTGGDGVCVWGVVWEGVSARVRVQEEMVCMWGWCVTSGKINTLSLCLSLSLGLPKFSAGHILGRGGERGEKPINVGQRTLPQSLPPTGREVMCQFLEVV